METYYLGDNRLMLRTFFKAKMVVPSDDFSLVPDLVFSRGIERGLSMWINQNIKAGMFCIDVGASFGYITLLLAMKVGFGGQVHAFEPDELSFECLRTNVLINYFDEIVDYYKNCVSSQDGKKVYFYTSQGFWGNSCIVKDPKGLDVKEIGTVTLDGVFSNDHNIDFVKIDVEGHELDVLKGMKKLLDEKRVKTVIFEFVCGRVGSQDLADWVRQYSNVLYKITEDGEEVPISVKVLMDSKIKENVLMRL